MICSIGALAALQSKLGAPAAGRTAATIIAAINAGIRNDGKAGVAGFMSSLVAAGQSPPA
jgi:hypothetical protein